MPTGTAVLSLPLLWVTQGNNSLSAQLSIPLLDVAGVGAETGILVSLRLPPLAVSGRGLRGIINLPTVLSLPILRTSSSSYGHVGSAILSLHNLIVKASGFRGLVGSGAISLPLLNLTGKIYFNPRASKVELSLPLLRVIGSGEGLLDVKTLTTPIRKGFAMNLVNWAVTEYEDYPFNSFAYFNGLQLGAKEDGIFILDGPDDNGKDILAYIETGTEDLFKKFMSRLREAWIESRQDGQMVLKVIMGEEETSPVCERPIESSGRHMHEERVKFPRGLKGRFASFRLENVNGSDVDIKRIKIFLEEVQRRR